MADPSSGLLRKINLVEVLKEEAESEGNMHLPPDLMEEQLQAWSEAEIRWYYAQRRKGTDTAQALAAQPAAQLTLKSHPIPSNGKSSSCEWSLDSDMQDQHEDAGDHSFAAPAADVVVQQHLSAEQLQQLSHRFLPPNPQQFQAWFPGLVQSRTACPNPTAVVLCFHSSGNAEDMYTSEGTGSRRASSPLLEACRAHGWQLLAVQLPGRGQRSKQQPLQSLQEAANQLLPIVAPALLAVQGRYAVIGHSMGCWAAYELLLLLRHAGFCEPACCCFSAMPWPHIPMGKRPWRQQKGLGEKEFKTECRGWDINELVFSPGMWEIYQAMLRADFRLFDEYEPSTKPDEAVQQPFQFPVTLFWGRSDRRVTQAMVEGWKTYTAGRCKVLCIEGNHLWPMQAGAKQVWLGHVVAELQQALPSNR